MAEEFVTTDERGRQRRYRFTGERGPLRCSFCGKEQQKVAKLIAGPGVYICNECITLCFTILMEESDGGGDPFRFAARRGDGSVEKVEVRGVQWGVGDQGALTQCRHCGAWLAGPGWTECAHCGEPLAPPVPASD